VREGLGIAPALFCAVSSHIDTGALSLLQVEGFPMRLAWFVAWSTDEVSAPARAFREHLLRQRGEIEARSLCPAYDISPLGS